jgi:twitching motility protein PilT
MARIDSILSILASQAANELRVGTDREPKMLAYGIAKRLSIPSTPEDTLRELLGEILSPEREEAMRARGRLEVTYDAGNLGAYRVTLTVRAAGGFDAAFVRDGARSGKGGSALPAQGEAHVAAPPPAPAAAVPLPPPSGSHRVAQPAASAPLVQVAPFPSATLALEAGASLSHLVARGVAMHASDLHLADGEVPVLRVDGALHRLDQEDNVDVAATIQLDAAATERARGGESVELGMEIAEVGRVRVHVYRTEDRLAAAIRLLPRAAPSLASLHMPVPLDDIIDLPHGLVLVCGATGAGKSTTLAALAQEAIVRRPLVLTTLEDPIEYALAPPPTSLVRRRQIGRDVRDFASGLRDSLREDPDLLLVGEMRDKETIGLALTAAETGHLVLASMHSRSAASAIERIVDSYPPERQQQIRVQLADSLRVVVAQRLVARARGGGRLPAIEVLRVNHAVAAIIREGKTAQIATAIQSGRREGMVSLERCLADRVQAGEITLDEARAVANDPSALATYGAR